MELPVYHELDTIHLQRLFVNTSECYKLFWFQSIIDEVHHGHADFTYDCLINNMIADAWYMVAEYKLNLGPNDTLEKLVLDASAKLGLKSSEKREKIICAIQNSDDPVLRKNKSTLSLNVPYRLQAPFLHEIKGKSWDGPKEALVSRINSYADALYAIDYRPGLASTVHVRERWCDYIRKNYDILQGWIKFNMIEYLQRRNPSVPGISSKLQPPEERNLDKVKALWRCILEAEPLFDIYGNTELDPKHISIDHFVPWSYVAHDELWNLHPTTNSINARKSNHLPDWNTYFEKFCSIEYTALQAIFNKKVVPEKIVTKCLQEHVNDADVRHRLYRPDISRTEFYNGLENVVRPVYDAARSLGFDEWVL